MLPSVWLVITLQKLRANRGAFKGCIATDQWPTAIPSRCAVRVFLRLTDWQWAESRIDVLTFPGSGGLCEKLLAVLWQRPIFWGIDSRGGPRWQAVGKEIEVL